MRLTTKLAKHLAVASCVLASVGVVHDQPAQAAIVLWNVNQAIPNNLHGLYLKVDTQQASTSTTARWDPPSGWDINPWDPTGLSFFAPAGFAPYVRTELTGPTSSLPLGFLVQSTSSFIGSNGRAVLGATTFNGWQLNSLNYFGFRFQDNSVANAIRYGWGSIQVGANSSQRTMVNIAYEDTGAPIFVGQVPGPLPILGAGSAFAWTRRLRRMVALRR